MTCPVRVAVIGTGFMGGMHARALAQSPVASLTHVVDVRIEAAAALVAEPEIARAGAKVGTDLRAVLADSAVDAVVLALPDTLHVDAAVAALRAGKAVLLEKPMAHDAAGARAIAAAAEAGPGRLMVGHICRFDPRYERAAHNVAAGAVGTALHVEMSRFCGHPGRRAVGSHLCWLMGVHDVDLIQWITGQRIQTVVAARALRDCIPEMAVGVEDVVMSLLELEGGALAQLSFGWTLPSRVPAGLQAGFRLVGTAGMIDLPPIDTGLLTVSSDTVGLAETRYWPTVDGRIGGSLQAEVAHFLAATHDGSPYQVPVAAALSAVLVNDAIMEALRTGGPVRVSAS